MNESDLELLDRYVRDHAEDAFNEVVKRYLDLVHSAAFRQVRSRQLAEEVAQATFLKLAREASRLRPGTILVAWLYQVTRREAIDLIRRESRRQLREQIATGIDTVNAEGPSEMLAGIEPLLDEAMHMLDESERAAILLRYFQNKSLREVGQTLGTTEDAARKRVNRAVERLRLFFARRGVAVTATGLLAILSMEAVQAAPIGLAATISTTALLDAGTVPASAIGLAKTLAMTTVQKTLIATTIAAALGTGIYQAQRIVQLQSQSASLTQQQDDLSRENSQLRQERDVAESKLAIAQRKNDLSSENIELRKLRAENTHLRSAERDLAQLKAAVAATGNDSPIEATLKTWAVRATQLKDRLNEMPEKGIPELKLLTEKDWFDAVKNAKELESDADFRKALNNLRNSAKETFGEMSREALKKYAEAHNGLVPDDLSQLQPYFSAPIDDAVLARYALAQKGKLADIPSTEFLIAEKAAPVDNEYDSVYEFRMNGTRSSSVNDPGDIVWEGLVQYANAHNGALSLDPASLAPYLKRPLDRSKVQDILSSLPPGITTLDQLKAAGPK